MPMTTIGDMRQQFLTSLNNTKLKTDLNTLVEELTTGRKSDLTAHLGSGQSNLTSIDRQLKLLDRFSQSNMEMGQLLAVMQSALNNIEQHRGSASSALLTINASSSPSQITDASLIAQAGFESTVQSLNMRSSDRSLFGGNDLDTSPLAAAQDMLDALKGIVSGLTDPGDVKAAIETWFDAPGGGFDTSGYQGDTTGFVTRPVDANQSIEINVRADDATFRDTLKAFALGALAGDTDLPLDAEARKTLLLQSGEALLSVASPLASAQGRLGYAEGQIEEASVRNFAQETSYGIARNNLVSADPFETATRLQAVQVQLETHYTVTARLSRLSLTEYLR